MKSQIRVLGIDDAAFNKNINKDVWIIGTVFRGGDFLDGMMTCRAKVDGSDATEKVTKMINKSKFKVQFRAILLDGIAVGGFNVFDIQELFDRTKIPVIVVMRNYPDLEKIRQTLININMSEKIDLLEKAGKIFAYKRIHFQFYGIEKKEAEEILDITSTHSYIPEPIRVAHLIGAGLVLGESKGRA